MCERKKLVAHIHLSLSVIALSLSRALCVQIKCKTSTKGKQKLNKFLLVVWLYENCSFLTSEQKKWLQYKTAIFAQYTILSAHRKLHVWIINMHIATTTENRTNRWFLLVIFGALGFTANRNVALFFVALFIASHDFVFFFARVQNVRSFNVELFILFVFVFAVLTVIPSDAIISRFFLYFVCIWAQNECQNRTQKTYYWMTRGSMLCIHTFIHYTRLDGSHVFLNKQKNIKYINK